MNASYRKPSVYNLAGVGRGVVAKVDGACFAGREALYLMGKALGAQVSRVMTYLNLAL